MELTIRAVVELSELALLAPRKLSLNGLTLCHLRYPKP